MAIEQLTVCLWHDRSMSSEEIRHPVWEQVELAIRDLNGIERNDLYLHSSAANLETWLCIGGGEGRYLVTGSVNSNRFPTVVVSMNGDAPHELLTVGGQKGDYPANWIVDREKALLAARSYFETGEFGSGDLIWIDA